MPANLNRRIQRVEQRLDSLDSQSADHLEYLLSLEQRGVRCELIKLTRKLIDSGWAAEHGRLPTFADIAVRAYRARQDKNE